MAHLKPGANVMRQLKEDLQGLSFERLIICGHSLGGGYATLCGLELLHEGEFNVSKVLAFGAPQVIRPDSDNELWLKLNGIASVYIHNWDVVPRLPSCPGWIDVLLSADTASWGPFKFKAIEQLRSGSLDKVLKLMNEFGHVGDLIFVSLGGTGAMRVPVFDEQGKVAPLVFDLTASQWLEITPKPAGKIMINDHINESYPKVTANLRDHVNGSTGNGGLEEKDAEHGLHGNGGIEEPNAAAAAAEPSIPQRVIQDNEKKKKGPAPSEPEEEYLRLAGKAE